MLKMVTENQKENTTLKVERIDEHSEKLNIFKPYGFSGGIINFSSPCHIFHTTLFYNHMTPKSYSGRQKKPRRLL